MLGKVSVHVHVDVFMRINVLVSVESKYTIRSGEASRTYRR